MIDGSENNNNARIEGEAGRLMFTADNAKNMDFYTDSGKSFIFNTGKVSIGHEGGASYPLHVNGTIKGTQITTNDTYTIKLPTSAPSANQLLQISGSSSPYTSTWINTSSGTWSNNTTHSTLWTTKAAIAGSGVPATNADFTVNGNIHIDGWFIKETSRAWTSGASAHPHLTDNKRHIVQASFGDNLMNIDPNWTDHELKEFFGTNGSNTGTITWEEGNMAENAPGGYCVKIVNYHATDGTDTGLSLIHI